ncbi:MAG: hypothetical protein ACJ8HU_03330, partial [Chthoniobacterales bacterium]
MNDASRRRGAARLLLLSLAAVLLGCGAVEAQVASPTPSAASPSPSPTPSPTPVALPDVVTTADSAAERLDQVQTEVATNQTGSNVSRELVAMTKEIDARADETKRMLAPGVPIETLRDLEVRWQRLIEQLGVWTRELTDRATALDRQIAQMPELRTTWKSTLELAQSSNAPPELSHRVEGVLKTVDAAEDVLRKRRAAILSLQTRVAEQTQRAQSASRSLKAAQSAAVNRLWVQDSAPIWSPDVRAAATQAIVHESQVTLGAQFAQLSAYVARDWPKLVYLALLLCAFAFVLFQIKHQAARWTEQDAALERANRVLQLPISTACVLAFLCARIFLEDAPRLVWIILATITLVPIVILLRRLIDRHLFPVVNALVVFYVVAQLRALCAALPVLSRIMLLLEMIGGIIFLAWFIRSTRTGPRTTSGKATRAAARAGVVLFALVFITNLFGYVALANYLGTGAL